MIFNALLILNLRKKPVFLVLCLTNPKAHEVKNQSQGLRLRLDGFYCSNTALNRSTVCDTAFLTKVKGGGGYYAQIMTLKSFKEVIDFRPKMKTIQTPMLIMKGQCDNQKWAFTKEYLDIFPNARLQVIPNAGHSIATEQQELYTRTIVDFLNS